MEKKSLVSGANHVTITLPRISCDYDPVSNFHHWLITWGDAEKKLSWANDFFRYNPEKIAESINEALKEVCEISKPYKLEVY